MHSHGWISSCYYVALPPSVDADSASAEARFDAPARPGWLTFGAPDVRVAGQALGARRAQPPRAGRLVLFPSFMWHASEAFTDTQTRLTLAFDVVPQA